MFSGIIKEVGVITQYQKQGESSGVLLRVRAALFSGPSGLNIGSSVAVSGVCLTATNLEDGVACFDVGSETLRCTTLGEQNVGSRVNLETSLRVGDPLDGHLVLGHVDGISKILRRTEEGNTARFEISIPESIRMYLVPKGSVAIDGVSLTIGEVTDTYFTVYIIPQTIQATTFCSLNVGEAVNVEADCIARYVAGAVKKCLRR